MAVLIEVDSGNRVSLGKLGHPGQYVAWVERDGTIIMKPIEEAR